MGKWTLYVILTQKGKLYTGITTDVERRFRQHCGEIKGGAKFFLSDSPEEIVHQEHFPDRSSASKRECEIKKMTRKQKEYLINEK